MVDLDFEALCLQRYEQIVTLYSQRLEKVVTLEADEELLNQPEDDSKKFFRLSSNQYAAVVFRSEQKKTLRA